MKEELETIWSGGRESALLFNIVVEVASLVCLLPDKALDLISPLFECVGPRPVAVCFNMCGCGAVEEDLDTLQMTGEFFLLFDSEVFWLLKFLALLSPPGSESSCVVPRIKQ